MCMASHCVASQSRPVCNQLSTMSCFVIYLTAALCTLQSMPCACFLAHRGSSCVMVLDIHPHRPEHGRPGPQSTSSGKQPPHLDQTLPCFISDFNTWLSKCTRCQFVSCHVMWESIRAFLLLPRMAACPHTVGAEILQGLGSCPRFLWLPFSSCGYIQASVKSRECYCDRAFRLSQSRSIRRSKLATNMQTRHVCAQRLMQWLCGGRSTAQRALRQLYSQAKVRER